MCGISGHIQSPFHPDPGLLRHRGPDYYGLWEGQAGGKQLFLAHHRLSILDLSPAGHQPMCSEDGNHILVFNGEIYNYLELRSRFFPGHPWKGHSDTELLLEMLQRFGMDALPHLNGDFAFAYLQKQSAKLWLVRDRFGIKPLYYKRDGEAFSFGSEIKVLQEAEAFRNTDPARLPLFLAFKFVPGNETLYRDVHRVPPAHFLEYNIATGSLHTQAYWEIPGNPECRMKYRDASQELKSLVQDAIRMRTLSDVPVGAFLSGGLDSTIIASGLRQHPDIRFYTAGKSRDDLRREGSTSDLHYARLLAKDWKLEMEEIAIGSKDLHPDLLDKIMHYGDDLIADGSQIPAWLIAEKAAASSRVLLSGMGADEVFFGYNWHQLTRLDLQLRKFPSTLVTPFIKGMQNLSQGKGRFLAYRRYLHKFGKYYQEDARRYAYYALVGDIQSALQLFPGREGMMESFFAAAFPEEADPFDSLFRYDLQHFLVKNLHYTDRMAMAHSIEVRVPFLDHRVVELAAAFPSSWKVDGLGKPKKILKDAFQNEVPAPIRKRRKAGFGMPLRSIFSSEEKLRSLLDVQKLSAATGLDAKAMESLIRHHLSGREDQSALLFALIMLQRSLHLR